MSNKEILEEIFEDLENNVGLVWTKWGRVTKSKLIDCWSKFRDENDAKYFGYTGKNGPNEAYKSLFRNIYHNKLNTKPWRDYILELYSYKYCSNCKKILKYECFGYNEQHVNNLTASCKSCNRLKNKKHYISNKSLYRAKYNKYRCSKIKRTPKWSDTEKIKEIYKNCPEGYHVDHIIPLQGSLVSGLHVPENLQYLTVIENLSKSNKFEVK